jgi:hypothetical protein
MLGARRFAQMRDALEELAQDITQNALAPPTSERQ